MTQCVFVYDGGLSPESEIANSVNGAASDHWVQSSDEHGIIFVLRRQDADGIFRVLYVNRLSENQTGVFMAVGESFSKYHVDALQKVRGLFRQYQLDNGPL